MTAQHDCFICQCIVVGLLAGWYINPACSPNAKWHTAPQSLFPLHSLTGVVRLCSRIINHFGSSYIKSTTYLILAPPHTPPPLSSIHACYIELMNNQTAFAANPWFLCQESVAEISHDPPHHTDKSNQQQVLNGIKFTPSDETGRPCVCPLPCSCGENGNKPQHVDRARPSSSLHRIDYTPLSGGTQYRVGRDLQGELIELLETLKSNHDSTVESGQD